MLEHYLWFITTNWLTVIISLIFVMFILNFWTSILEIQLWVIWKKIKIPWSVRWATFDAISSSLPEFLTSLVWLFILWNKWLEVGIWTIAWSAIFNILIIPAFVLLTYKWIKKISIHKWYLSRDTIFYILSIIILLLGLYSNALTIMSIALMMLYIVYIIVLYKNSIKHKKENNKEIMEAYNEVKDIKISYLKIVIALFLIYLWVEIAVTWASWIWEKLHISMLIISLVLLAWVTSIPDTLLSIKSSKKWDADAWISNAVGSNIFDICIWLGLPIFLWTTFLWLNPETHFNQNIWIFSFLIISIIIYFIILYKKNIWKKDSIYLFILYSLFIIYLAYLSIK